MAGLLAGHPKPLPQKNLERFMPNPYASLAQDTGIDPFK